MDVKMQVRHLLMCSRTGRMPDAKAVGGKHRIDRTRDTSDRGENGRCNRIVGRPNVRYVVARDDENVPGMKLTRIQEGEGECVRD